MKKVKIFTADDSLSCKQLKSYLSLKKIQFEEIDIGRNKEEAARLIHETGYSMVPQVQIDDKFIVGFDPKKIDELLEKD